MRLRWFPRLSLTVLPPARLQLPPELMGRARRAALGRIMQDIMTEAAFRPERLRHSLFAALLDAGEFYDRGLPVVADIVPMKPAARRYGTDLSPADPGAVVLGRKLAAITRPGEHVGVMLPNAVGTVVTFFALQSQARVPAMMNFTAGAEAMLSCCAAAQVRTVLTSRRAVQKGKLDKLVEAVATKVRVVYLEDVRASIGLRTSSWDVVAGCRGSCWVRRTGRPRWCCLPPDPRGRRRLWCTAIARCWPIARSCGRWWTSTRRTGCSMRCRCFIRSA